MRLIKYLRDCPPWNKLITKNRGVQKNFSHFALGGGKKRKGSKESKEKKKVLDIHTRGEGGGERS